MYFSSGSLSQFIGGYKLGGSGFKGTIFDFMSTYSDTELRIDRHNFMYNGGKGITLEKTRLRNGSVVYVYYRFSDDYYSGSGFAPIINNSGGDLYLALTSGSPSYKTRKGIIIT